MFQCRFKVYYVLNTPPEGWNGGTGFVNKAMIKQHFEPPSDDVIICRCGPPAMNKAMRSHLVDIGYTQDMLFEF